MKQKFPKDESTEKKAETNPEKNDNEDTKRNLPKGDLSPEKRQMNHEKYSLHKG